MPVSARFYLCARCRSQTFVCRTCDRGQLYCASGCAAASRSQSQREARQRYSKTRRARTLNAERQHRYRLRQRAQEEQRVTDQGSRAGQVRRLSNASIEARAAEHLPSAARPAGVILCDHCACECATGVRLGFLKRGYRQRQLVKPPP